MTFERTLAYVGAVTLGAAACLLFVVANDSHADPFTDPGIIDRTIPYEGVLEIDGTEVMSGTHTFDFAVWDGPESDGGAVQLWPATGWASEDLDVRAGRFAVQIGASDGPAPVAGFEPLPDEVFEADQLYLAIQVDDALLSGRQRINTVPWSVRSGHALHADAATTGSLLALDIEAAAPVGTIVAYWGTEAPPGWLLCDGNTDLAGNAAYVELRALVGPTTPNLGGMFLRGLNNGRTDGNEDPDDERTIGSIQGDAFGQHQHRAGFKSSWTDGAGSGFAQVDWHADFEDPDPPAFYTTSVGDPDETRPTNIAVNYIIKY